LIRITLLTAGATVQSVSAKKIRAYRKGSGCTAVRVLAIGIASAFTAASAVARDARVAGRRAVRVLAAIGPWGSADTLTAENARLAGAAVQGDPTTGVQQTTVTAQLPASLTVGAEALAIHALMQPYARLAGRSAGVRVGLRVHALGLFPQRAAEL
jgi:hypothetical protein